MAELEVCFVPWPGAEIFENVVGLGATREAAMADAIGCFAHMILHVLLRAFIDPTEPAGTMTVTPISVHGRAVELVTGPFMTRGPAPREAALAALLRSLQRAVVQHVPDAGMHAVRLFYAQRDRAPVGALEVALDGRPWPEAARLIPADQLPSADGYASARIFAITGETCGVERAAALMAAMAAATDEAIVDALVEHGAAPVAAELMTALVPCAFARVFFERKFDFRFAPIATARRGARGAETFVLADHPLFVAARRYAEARLDEGPRSLFTVVAQRSAEFLACNRIVGDEAPREIKAPPSFAFSDDVPPLGAR